MDTRKLSIYNYIGYFFIGLISIMFAPVLPSIIKEFGISVALAGSIFPVRFAGTFLGTLAGGIISDYKGRKPVIIFGSLIQAIAAFVIASSGQWIYGLIFFGVSGFGTGLMNTTINALTADINSNRKGAALNILHGVYSVGCLLGPIIAGSFLITGHGWRIVFYGSAVIWLIYGIITMFFTYPSVTTTERTMETLKNKYDFRKGISMGGIFFMLFFVSFIYNGAATGLVGWINTYMDQMEVSLLFGSGMVSVFYAGLTVGRFTCGRYSEKIGYPKIILICALGSFLFYPLAVYTNYALLISIGVFFTGLFMSGLHPTSLAYANNLFPGKAGTVTALLSVSMSLGAMSVPWLIGIIADRSGFKAGLSISLIILFILVLIGLRVIKYKPEKAPLTVKE